MDKQGYQQKTSKTTLTIPDGRVGKFDLEYVYTHQQEELSRVNYYTPESESEKKRIRFNLKGYQFDAPLWQLHQKSALTSDKTLEALNNNGLGHYILAETKIDGHKENAIVMLTAKEYQAIKDWFKSVSLIKPKNKNCKRYR